LTPEQRQHTLLRSDSAFGCDYNLDYALDAGWQVLSKGYGGRRAVALAKKVRGDAWQDLEQDRWVAVADDAPTYVRPVQYLLLRWQTERGKLKHGSVICSVLEWCIPQIVAHYDDRGACETQIQADKGGLKMGKRRKMRLSAQEALILLTDVAHNTLAWASHWMSLEQPLTTLGTTRLIEDVFTIPGRLTFSGEQLVEVQLNELHPYAEPVAAGLERLLDHFGHP